MLRENIILPVNGLKSTSRLHGKLSYWMSSQNPYARSSPAYTLLKIATLLKTQKSLVKGGQTQKTNKQKKSSIPAPYGWLNGYDLKDQTDLQTNHQTEHLQTLGFMRRTLCRGLSLQARARLLPSKG